MGTYLDAGNSGFVRMTSAGYVDKTGLISLINQTIGTGKNLTCISMPRRFGKSYAAQMLCAYYDVSCDSRGLFADYEIAHDASFEQHLNKYHVINLDVTSFVSEAEVEGTPLRDVPARISLAVRREAAELCPACGEKETATEALIALVNATGSKVVFVIDEWDALIREAAHDEEAQNRYLSLLRSWFKNNSFTPKVVAAAYMTGILPIKKNDSQSAISDFREYSVLDPGGFATYVGFTEREVRELCEERGRSFARMQRWYDGYTVGDTHSMYNPYSVMHALDSGRYKSYWKKTSAADALMTYIDMDQDGLQADIARLMAGEQVEIETDSFQNDVETFTRKDDVLTLMVHLGYLTYEEVPDSYDDEDDVMASLCSIPNEEVRTEFDNVLRRARHPELVALVRRSDELLEDTLAGREAKVAKAIQDVHDSEYAPTFYNNDQSLRYVVKMAYLSCVDQYAKIEELPSGHGLADVVFLPKRRSALPAMVVELKWEASAGSAIQQIRERNYPKVLEGYGGDIVLVGVNYDTKTKEHSCKIERHPM